MSKTSGSKPKDPKLSRSLRPGDRVRGIIYRILWDRILLRLPDGSHGIIRRREFSWESEPQVPSQLAKLNTVIEAVVLAVDPATQSVDLSLRFIQYDPWQNLTDRLPLGTVLDAAVLRIRDFGTFVELEAGIEGLIPTTERSRNSSTSSLAVPLWPEDLVRVVIVGFDIQRRQIRLSLQRHMIHGHNAAHASIRQGTGSAHLSDFMDQKTLRRLLQKVGDLPTAICWPPPDRILNILVADDNADFKASLAELLREVGYVVYEAISSAEALQQLEVYPCDLAILDLSLSTDNPLELARQARSICPSLRVLLLTGFEIEASVSRQAEDLGFRIESKPLGPRALAEVLSEFENSEASIRHDPPIDPLVPKVRSTSVSTSDLREFVERVRLDAGADYAIIFEKDSQRPSRVLWSYCDGVKLDNSEDFHTTLLYSPVGEVLRDRRTVVIIDSQQVPRRVSYLVRAVPFTSCLGMPVEIPSRDQPYAFFLFYKKEHFFPDAQLNKFSAFCRELGQIVFRQHEFERFVGLQEELLQSRLRSGALHDIRNTLGSMAFKLNSLENILVKSTKTPAETLEAALSHVLSIQTFADQMEKTTSLLRDLTEDTHLALVDINVLVHRLVERQHLLASHLAVKLSFEPDLRVPASILRSAQLQQVVDNIMLNALQWCQGRQTKQVAVSSYYDLTDAALPIKIRVVDTGPGIHRRLQSSSIFELGFSQREGGSGLGLFVSKALIEAMGGNIIVEYSVMDVGTTFLISLPHRPQ